MGEFAPQDEGCNYSIHAPPFHHIGSRRHVAFLNKVTRIRNREEIDAEARRKRLTKPSTWDKGDLFGVLFLIFLIANVASLGGVAVTLLRHWLHCDT